MHLQSSETRFASLHPEASLYEGVIAPNSAVDQLKKFRQVLESYEAQIFLVTDVLANETFTTREELIEFADQFLTYDLSYLPNELNEVKKIEQNFTGKKLDNFRKAISEFESKINAMHQDEYRKRVLSNLNKESLIDVIFNRPKVELHLRSWFGDGDNLFLYLRSKIISDPLSNLYFMRDQQITTQKGIILLRSAIRPGENEVTKFVFRKLGFKIIGELRNGYAEGGDFMPMGNKVFIGQGLRTTKEAIDEMLENDYFGVKEVVVVKDMYDHSQQRMHLDTFFNVLNDDTVLISDEIENEVKKRRWVDVYFRSASGKYSLTIKDREFVQYLVESGFKIVRVTKEEQENYAVNFLNMGNGRIIVAYDDQNYFDLLKAVGVNAKYVNISALTKGYGGPHCMTQVIWRERKICWK
ncbi:hypothetical protein B4U79_16161 [Dinothrombium tinctorium]|uniref:Arginine deiminase n=1 Tax=Dinothrombium tinctorium TaxID=1965070 RepID=A0A3S3RZN3_9ACAR|nr:hypothetical protein B4U79_16161 [Dinothrombium tinctorium]